MTHNESEFVQPAHFESSTAGQTQEVELVPELAGQTIEQIKRELLDPRTISKKHDNAGRSSTKDVILEARARKSVSKRSLAEKDSALQQTKQKLQHTESSRTERKIALDARLATVAARLKQLVGATDRQATDLEQEIGLAAVEIEALSWQARSDQEAVNRLANEQTELPNPKKLLEAYYERMETIPLSNAEKRELLKPEVLAALSTEEYIALWRRLNPHFLSHVTRQGFRDHIGTNQHSDGVAEFHSGLTSVLQDEKLLRSPFTVRDGLFIKDEESVRNLLGASVLKAEDAVAAKERLYGYLNYSFAAAPKYPDKTAIHFAAERVLDGLYGGERNNEVFFLYPTDFIASQYDYAFNGPDKDFTDLRTDKTWNDVFVWPSSLDNPCITTDAGIVFLPEDTTVDVTTGSKYASEIKTIDGKEVRVMIEDQNLVVAFSDWIINLNNNSPVVLAFKESRRCCFDVLRQELLKLGFCEDAAGCLVSQIMVSDCIRRFIDNGKFYTEDEGANLKPEVAAHDLLNLAGANWKMAERTTSAKKYWETYFIQHPEQKPKHFVYYNGDPTTAVLEFQQKNNIGQADVSRIEGKLLGFDDKHVDIYQQPPDPRAYRGYDELVVMAHRIIEEHYEGKEKE